MTSQAACGGMKPALAPAQSPSRSSVPKNTTTLLARVNGDNLCVSFVDEDGYEMCFWFCPTMDNKLFSFHRVGFRQAGASPSVDGIVNGKNISWLNVTKSDNIGPLNMSKLGWIGGNHLVNETRTAVTRSVNIKADNNTLNDARGAVSCNSVTIDVVNDILNPSSAVTKAGTFGETLLLEKVHYRVVRNAIEVTVTHEFKPGVNNRVATYYGMQSMFYKEDKIMTPHGPYTDFIDHNKVEAFKLCDYPAFDRFIEMNSSVGWCQAAHLLREGIGDHRHLNSRHNVFVTSTYGKNYHVLIREMSVMGGTTYSWRGIYSWFRPLVNNGNVLVYSAVLDGEEAIFVDAKRSCNVTIALPARWAAASKKVVVAQADNGMALNVENAAKVRLNASRAGTAILKLAAK